MKKLYPALSPLLLAALLSGCSSTPPQSAVPVTAATPSAVGTPLKATVTQGGMPATAPMTHEQTATTPEQKAMLDKIAGSMKGKSASDYHERGSLYLMAAEEMKISEAYRLAADDFGKAIELDPKMIGAYSNRAMAHVRVGDGEAALADFDAALKIAPDNAQILGSKASLLAKLGRDDEAISAYDQSYKLGNTDVAFNRGNAYMRLGKKDMARRDYELVIKESKNPQLVEAAKGNLTATE